MKLEEAINQFNPKKHAAINYKHLYFVPDINVLRRADTNEILPIYNNIIEWITSNDFELLDISPPKDFYKNITLGQYVKQISLPVDLDLYWDYTKNKVTYLLHDKEEDPVTRMLPNKYLETKNMTLLYMVKWDDIKE